MIVYEVATTARNVPSERKEMFGTRSMARMCASLLQFNSEDRPELGCDARKDPSERKEVFGTRKGRMCLLFRFNKDDSPELQLGRSVLRSKSAQA